MAPNFAIDSDCDGLDELSMDFYPFHEVWEWDITNQQFVTKCSWNKSEFGTMHRWYDLDLNQDNVSEWVTINHEHLLRAFSDFECLGCDTVGHCVNLDSNCYCYCFGDPDCNGITDVFDVVEAVKVAFRGGTPMNDPFPQCPKEKTDIDCNGVTDVFDVVDLVDVAFRSADPVVAFCDPCEP